MEGDKFKYKPVYNIKDRKSLLRLLDKNDQRGLGGVFLEHVEESLPNVQKALKVSRGRLHIVTSFIGTITKVKNSARPMFIHCNDLFYWEIIIDIM